MFLVSLLNGSGHASYVAHPGGKSRPGPDSVAAKAALRVTSTRSRLAPTSESSRSLPAAGQSMQT